MATTIESIQQLYIAFFNRPADAGGLDFWVKDVAAGTSLASIAAQFAAQDEYKAEYGGKSPEATVAQIYQNLFNRLPDPTGLAFWAQGLRAGTYTVDTIVAEVAASAQQDPAKGPDTVAIQSKVAAAVAFTDYLKTDTAALIAYSTGAVNGVAKDYIAGVTNATSLADATAGLSDIGTSLVEGGNPGSAFALTAGIDTFPGTAGNDTFNAATLTAGHALSGLDSIDGGAGIDTLNVTSSAGGDIDFSKATVTNVEKLVVRSVDDLGATNNAVNITAYSGLTSASFDLTSSKDVAITASKTTSVTITDNGTGKAAVIGGGGAISVTTDNAVTVGGGVANAYTSVTVVDAAGATITDNSGASAAVGKTLTTVSLDGLTAASTVTGNGITTLNYSNTDKAVAITSTVAHALTVNVDGLEAGAKVTENKANAVTVNAVGDAEFVLEADGAKTLAVAGKGDVTLGAGSYDKLTAVTYTGSGSFKATFDNTTAAELLSINSSAATGSLDVTIVGTNNAADPDAETAQSVTGGAGDDKVTITGVLGKGSTLSLGGGSDTVAVSGAGQILGDAVVDAGAGTDTLALSVVDATNVASFKNFELFDVAGATGTFDQEILDSKNNVTGFVGSAALAAGGAELANLGAGVGFTVLGDMGTTDALTLTQVTGGALTITSDVDSEEDAGDVDTAAAFVSTTATSVKLVFDNNNVDEEDSTANLTVSTDAATKYDIVSGGTEVTNTAAITDTNDKLVTVNVTGSQHLTLQLTGTEDKLKTVDASGATGGVSVDVTELAAAATVKLGSGDDVVTVGVSTTASAAIVNGLEKGSEAELDEQDGFDVIHFAGSSVAADHDAAAAGAFSIADGLYKLGSDPAAPVSNLDIAFTQVDTNVAGAGEAVVFTYASSTYLFIQGGAAGTADDVLVKLTGTSGIKGLSAVGGADDLYLI